MKKQILCVLAISFLLVGCKKGNKNSNQVSSESSNSVESTTSSSVSSSSTSSISSSVNSTVSSSINSSSNSEVNSSSSSEVSSNTETPAKRNATELMISEYFEGTGNDKYIELFNGTGKRIDLSEYSIKLIANGGNVNPKDTNERILNLHSILKDGLTYTIGTYQLSDGLKDKVDYKANVCDFNGDDVIQLLKGDEVIDVVGDLKTYSSGNGWTVDGVENATIDHTLTRKNTIYSPSSVFHSYEWNVLNCDDSSNIGIHDLFGYTPIVDDEEIIEEDPYQNEGKMDLIFSEYVCEAGSANNKYVEIYNPKDEDVDLTPYAIELYKKDSIAVSQTLNLTGVLKSKETYVIANPYAQDESIIEKKNIDSSICYFSGKHSLALTKNGTPIDIIGKIGYSPDAGLKGWPADEDGIYTLDDCIITRVKEISIPNVYYTYGEWEIGFDFSSIGVR